MERRRLRRWRQWKTQGEIGEAGMCGSWSGDDDSGVDNSEARDLRVEGNDMPVVSRFLLAGK